MVSTEFREALKLCMDKNGLTVSELSRKSGVTRTLIHAILNGTRRLVPQKFGTMINRRFFPSEDCEQLFGAYLSEELTQEERSLFREMLCGLRGETADEIRGVGHGAAPSFPDLPHAGVGTVIHGRDGVVGAIARVVCEGTEKFISDFDFDGVISPIVLRAYADKKIGSVTHPVRLGGANGTYDPAKKLKNLFAALAFAEAGIATTEDDRGGGAWDRYILTDRYFIQYSSDLSQALILPPENAPDTLGERRDAKSDLTTVFNGVFDAVVGNEMEEMPSGQKRLFSVCDVIPECFVTEDDILRSIAPEVPEKDKSIMTMGLRKHYEVILGPDFYGNVPTGTLCCVMPDSAITEFVANGRIKDAPPAVFPFVPYDVRANMLRPFLSRPNAEIRIVDSHVFGKMRTNIEGNSRNLILAGVTGGDINAPGAFKDIRVASRDRNLSSAVLKLIDYFVGSHYCLGEKDGRLFLEQQIISLNALAAGE